MLSQNLYNLERISYIKHRKKNGLYLDSNEKIDIWDRIHFDKIYKNINTEQFCYYPDDNFDFLNEKICNHFNISKFNFIEGLGSDYLIRDFLILFNEPENSKKKNIITYDLGYGMYSVYTKGLNYNLSYFDYEIDTSSEEIYFTNKEKLFSQISKNEIIVITNPNQISNYDFSFEDLEILCKLYPNKIFLIDEAYYGYGGFTAIELIKKFKNIFVLRSFSKEYGIASLRYGLLFGNEESIKYFKNISSVYNTNIFTAKTVEYFLDNYNLIEEHKNNVINGREFIIKKLKDKGYKIFSTNTMSIFIFFKNKHKTEEIYNYLFNNDIYTKLYADINAIRITCGPIYIMEKLLKYFDYNYEYFLDLYKTKGYFTINNFFTDSELFKINNVYNLEKNYTKYETNIYNGKILRLEKFLKNNIYVKNMIENKLSCFLTQLLGEEWQLFKDKIIEKHPNCKNEFYLHYDGIFKTYNYRLKKELLGWWGYSNLFTNVNIMLTDNTYENGALGIGKNNFNQNINDLNYIIDNKIVDRKNGFIIKDVDNLKSKCKFITGKKGSVLFFNPLCPHFSRNNNTNFIRRNIYLTYCSKTNDNIYDIYNNDKDLLIKNIGKDKFENECLNEQNIKNNN